MTVMETTRGVIRTLARSPFTIPTWLAASAALARAAEAKHPGFGVAASAALIDPISHDVALKTVKTGAEVLAAIDAAKETGKGSIVTSRILQGLGRNITRRLGLVE